MLGEPGGVDVDADLPEVDGGQGRGVVDDVLVGALGQVDGGSGVDDLLGQDAGGEGVVDTEDGVTERGVLGLRVRENLTYAWTKDNGLDEDNSW